MAQVNRRKDGGRGQFVGLLLQVSVAHRVRGEGAIVLMVWELRLRLTLKLRPIERVSRLLLSRVEPAYVFNIMSEAVRGVSCFRQVFDHVLGLEARSRPVASARAVDALNVQPGCENILRLLVLRLVLGQIFFEKSRGVHRLACSVQFIVSRPDSVLLRLVCGRLQVRSDQASAVAPEKLVVGRVSVFIVHFVLQELCHAQRRKVLQLTRLLVYENLVWILSSEVFLGSALGEVR